MRCVSADTAGAAGTSDRMRRESQNAGIAIYQLYVYLVRVQKFLKSFWWESEILMDRAKGVIGHPNGMGPTSDFSVKQG